VDQTQRDELTAITDDLVKIGKPGRDDRVTANHRLVLMRRLLELIVSAEPDVRHEIVSTFTETLRERFRG
jgi:hypothetical protein